MNIREIFSFGQRRREIGTSAQQGSGTTGDTSRSASYAQNIERVGSEGKALTISAYYRALELRARTMSQLVWSYQRINRMGGNYVNDFYGRNRQLNYLLMCRPNPLMTACEFSKRLELAIIQQGNGVAYIERDELGEVQALWLCQSADYLITDNTYSLTYYRPGGAVYKTGVSPNDVIHLRNTYTTADGLSGIPTLRYMRTILELDATNTRLQLETAAKGGRVKLVVQEKDQTQQGLMSHYSQKQMEQVTQRFRDDVYNYDVAMLSNAAGFQNISMTMADLQVLESHKQTDSDVARFLSVPEFLLGGSDGAGYKSPEAAMQTFLQHCIAPNIRALEDELNSKLLGEEDFGSRRIHVCDQHLRRLDPTGQAKLNENLLRIGVKTVNDLRNEYDMPAIAKGDTPYLFSGLAELGSDKLRATQATNVKPSDQNNDNKPTEEGGEA